MYKAGSSLSQIGHIFNRTASGILQVLKKRNVRRRGFSSPGCHRKYTLNEDCFDNLSPEAKYWIGFILADGCINNSRTLTIRLGMKDKSHLDKLRTFLGTNCPVTIVIAKASGKLPERKQVNLCICSVRLVAKLAKLGITKNKSLTATPHISLLYDKDFWRGLVDGDGCIYLRGQYKVPIVSLVGSKNIIDGFLTFSKSITTTTATRRKKSVVFTTSLTSQPARDLLNVLYYKDCIALDRKISLATDKRWVKRIKKIL